MKTEPTEHDIVDIDVLEQIAALHRLHKAAPAIIECVKEALTMAENLRKATGDAIPAAICHTLRAAIAMTEPPKEPNES